MEYFREVRKILGMEIERDRRREQSVCQKALSKFGIDQSVKPITTS